MSFFKRVSNLGKGMWKVNMGPGDPDEDRRIKALQAELSRMEAEAGLGSATRVGAARSVGAAARSAVPEATDEELLAAKLELLADQLREGRIDRETYDARSAELIAALEGEEAPRTEGPVKRTL